MSRSSFPAKRLKHKYIDYLAEMIGDAHCTEDRFFSELDNVLSNNPELVNGQDKDGNTMIHLCFLHGKDGHLQAIISRAESKGITLQMPNNNEKQNPADLAPANDKTISLIKQLSNHYQKKSFEELEQVIESTALQSIIYEINDDIADQKLLASISKGLSASQKALNYAKREGYHETAGAMQDKHDESLAADLGLTKEDIQNRRKELNSLSDQDLLKAIAPDSIAQPLSAQSLLPKVVQETYL